MPVQSGLGGAKVVVSGSRGNDETGVGGSVGRGVDDVSAGVAMLSFRKGDELEWRSRFVFHPDGSRPHISVTRIPSKEACRVPGLLDQSTSCVTNDPSSGMRDAELQQDIKRAATNHALTAKSPELPGQWIRSSCRRELHGSHGGLQGRN